MVQRKYGGTSKPLNRMVAMATKSKVKSQSCKKPACTVVIYNDARGEYRWRLLHKNGKILADSGEGYTRRSDASRAVIRVPSLLLTAEVRHVGSGSDRCAD